MVTTLIIPFIALAILSVMVDKLTAMLEEVMHRIPFLPDQFWGPVAYLIVFTSGLLVCWRGQYDFFSYLNFTFQHQWEGWILTALLLSGGSVFVRASFDMANKIPNFLTSAYNSFSGYWSDDTTTETEDDPL